MHVCMCGCMYISMIAHVHVCVCHVYACMHKCVYIPGKQVMKWRGGEALGSHFSHEGLIRCTSRGSWSSRSSCRRR